MRKPTLQELKAADKRAGEYFFSRDTMKAFGRQAFKIVPDPSAPGEWLLEVHFLSGDAKGKVVRYWIQPDLTIRFKASVNPTPEENYQLREAAIRYWWERREGGQSHLKALEKAAAVYGTDPDTLNHYLRRQTMGRNPSQYQCCGETTKEVSPKERYCQVCGASWKKKDWGWSKTEKAGTKNPWFGAPGVVGYFVVTWETYTQFGGSKTFNKWGDALSFAESKWKAGYNTSIDKHLTGEHPVLLWFNGKNKHTTKENPHFLSHDLPPDLHEISDALAETLTPEEAKEFSVALLQDAGATQEAAAVNEVLAAPATQENPRFPAPPPGYAPELRFKDLKIGDKFDFPQPAPGYGSYFGGPFFKTSSRGYEEEGTGKKFKVGSTNVEVVRSNPQQWLWPYRKDKLNFEKINEQYGLLHDIGFDNRKWYRIRAIVAGDRPGTYNASTFRGMPDDTTKRADAIRWIKEHTTPGYEEGTRSNPKSNTVYKGWLKAGKGFLLGGVKTHWSSSFATRKEAEQWTLVAVETNRDAGRDVADWGIKELDRRRLS